MYLSHEQIVNHVWKRLIRSNDEDSDEFLSRSCLLENMTYRLPAASSKDPFIGWKVWFRLLFNRYKTEKAIQEYAISPIGIIGNSPTNEPLIHDYIERSSREKIGVYWSKDALSGIIRPSFGFMLRSMGWAFRAMTSAQRIGYASLIREYAEVSAVAHLVMKNKIQKVYDFIPYEKDSNFLALVLRELRVQCIKVPSPGPLVTHHSVLIADALVISSHYQAEELPKLSSGVRVNQLLRWVPERSFTYASLYKTRPEATPSTIGFYSHGEWLRKAQGHADHGLNILGAEGAILEQLAHVLSQNKEWQLTLFLHPKEKVDIKGTEQFYRERLKGVSFKIAEIPTAHGFHHVDVAVSAFSTIIFERLFFGYKMLIGNKGMEDFPMPSAALRNVAFDSDRALEAHLNTIRKMTSQEFFNQFDLKCYTVDHYPDLKQLLDLS